MGKTKFPFLRCTPCLLLLGEKKTLAENSDEKRHLFAVSHSGVATYRAGTVTDRVSLGCFAGVREAGRDSASLIRAREEKQETRELDPVCQKKFPRKL